MNEQGLLETTGGELAECEDCGEPIPASAGYGAVCVACDHDRWECPECCNEGTPDGCALCRVVNGED